jgi:uncharacterized protein HemX
MEYIQNVNPTPQPSAGGKSARNMAIVVVLMIVLIAVAGAAYWWLVEEKKESVPGERAESQIQSPQNSAQNNQSAAVRDDTITAIDQDLNAVGDVGTADSQFTDVNKDIQGL